MQRSWRLAGGTLLAVAVVVLLTKELTTADQLDLAAHHGAYARLEQFKSACKALQLHVIPFPDPLSGAGLHNCAWIEIDRETFGSHALCSPSDGLRSHTPV